MNSSATTALLLLCLLAAGSAVAADPPPSPEVLTNAAQVRSLSAAEAAQARPVRLRGVVVDAAFPDGSAVVLADDTSDIYLLATNLFQTTVYSDRLEVEGVTDPGQFAPIVKVTRLQKTGTSPLPAPRPFSYQQLISGALDAQWVEISGVVHRCLFTTNNIWRIHIAADGGMLTVRGWMPCDPQMQEDAEVRLRALCFYQFNQKRQLLTPVLQVPRHANVQVLRPAPANPFAAPLRLAEGLLQFSPESSSGHRVHVRGVVTHCQPGGTIWIHDQATGLRIHASQPRAGLAPGDEIDVLGFPALDSAAPVLEDAIYRRTGTAPVPAPHFLTNAVSAFDYEADLIALDALITGVQPVLEGTALELRASNTVFKALLKNTDSAKMPDWQPGSRVRIAGICSVIHDEVRPLMGIWQPQTFQILLRSPADLVFLSRPSWWTPLHISYLLGLVIGGLLLLLGLLALAARRRLNEQNHQRAMAEAEFAAILAERNRMAREIHDTLAQGLVATSVQLRLAKKQGAGAAEALLQHLDSAQQLVRRSLQDARDSIWNMRSQALENGDLSTALRDVLRQLVDDAEIKTAFEVAGAPRRLAPMVENNLLRVGQEAMTNAAKHAQARHIRVQLDFDEKQFQLRVSDDGCGFNPVATTPAKDGFGLVGMRERIAALQGELHIRSAPGQGTEIHVTLPLSN